MNRLTCCLPLFLLLTLPAIGATRTWSGAANSLWNNAANWGGTLPLAGDDLVFPAGAANVKNTNDLPAGTRFHAIAINGASYAISGNAIQLVAGISVSGSGFLSLLTPITLTAPQTWSSNVSSRFAVTFGTVDVGPHTLTLDIANNDTTIKSIAGNGAIIDTVADNVSVNGGTFTGTINVSGIFYLNHGTAGNITMNGHELGLTSSHVGSVDVLAGRVVLNQNGAWTSGNLTFSPSAAGSGSEFVYFLSSDENTVHDVSGTVSLGNTHLKVSASLVPPGQVFTLIRNNSSAPVNGTFVGLPEGAIFNRDIAGGSASFRISYKGGDGNDVTVAVLDKELEPSTTTVTSSVNPAAQNEPLRYTATVTSHEGTVSARFPDGAVNFFAGPLLVGSANLDASGKASVTTTLAAGVYNITAAYAGTSVYASSQSVIPQTVNAAVVAPTVVFTASPTIVEKAQSSTLSWTSMNATMVTLNVAALPQPLNGSIVVTPTYTTTYTLTATGPGGSVTRQVTVYVPPTIVFFATPATIAAGSNATLDWATVDATNVMIDNGIGSQPATGRVGVHPTTTTTYTLTATGAGGTKTALVTVNVAAGKRRAAHH